MKKRFIVLVDFSEHSRQLIVFAHSWATEIGAELLFIHHSTEPVPGFGDTDIRAELKNSHNEQALEKLRNFTEDITGLNMTATYHVDHYNLSSAVLKLQKKDTTDYIFSGIRHKSQLETLLTGNTATSLAEDLNNIIIAIPEDNQELSLRSLYVAVKDGFALNEYLFEQLLDIRKNETGNIIFFTVLKEGAEETQATQYLEYLQNRYGNVANVTVNILYSNDTKVAIKDYVLSQNGVLVVQKGSRNFADIFRKYFTAGIVRDGHVPVIILP